MKAMLKAVWDHNQSSTKKINKVVCPGLGTSTGQMPPKEAARLMYLAYQNFRNPPSSINWYYASKRQQEIVDGGNLGNILRNNDAK